MPVQNLKITPWRTKVGYRASKSPKEKKEWKSGIFCKRQEKNKEVFWVPQKLTKFKGRIWCELSNMRATAHTGLN